MCHYFVDVTLIAKQSGEFKRNEIQLRGLTVKGKPPVYEQQEPAAYLFVHKHRLFADFGQGFCNIMSYHLYSTSMRIY